MEKKNRWAEDTMVMCSRDARAKLKMKALMYEKGLTLKDYLTLIANAKEVIIK